MHNPLLKVQDPYENYKNSFADVNDKNLEFQRLCFEIFHMNPNGKALWQQLLERFIMKQLFDINHPNVKEHSIWWAATKAAYLGLWDQGTIHLNRISGVKK